MNVTSYALPEGMKILAGVSHELICRPSVPFAPETRSLLESLSKRLLSNPLAKEYPDIVTFAFWCRRANITQKESEWQTRAGAYPRIGRGLIFHVAPSNVPINFAYSFVFSLLAGNSNIVRVPSKEFAQIDIVCAAIDEALHEYPALFASNSFVRYAAGSEISSQLSAFASGRVIWGGDDTVTQIRTLPPSPRCVDIVFPDRYSIALFDANSLVNLDEQALGSLVNAFYNDTYLMDQNACSSPQVLFWVGNNKKGRERFWQALAQCAQAKYHLQAAVSVDKYVKLCEDTVREVEGGGLQAYDPYLTHVDITDYLKNHAAAVGLSGFRGTGGYYYEAAINTVDEAMVYITQKYQTLVYFGLDPSSITQALVEARVQGIDRIVPVGEALSIDIIWDGYDLIGQLSRIIEVR